MRGHRRDEIRIHDGLTLTSADVTIVENIPCTTLARTLLDVCEDATRRELERALDVADQRLMLLGGASCAYLAAGHVEPASVAHTLRRLLI